MTKKYPGLSRDQVLAMARAAVSPEAAAVPRAPAKVQLSDEAKAAIDAAVARGGARMKLTPEEAARVTEEAASVRAMRAPKGRRAKVAPPPAVPTGKTEAAVSAPPPPAPPIAGGPIPPSGARPRVARKAPATVAPPAPEAVAPAPTALPEGALLQRLKGLWQVEKNRPAIEAQIKETFGEARFKQILKLIKESTSRIGAAEGGTPPKPAAPPKEMSLEEALKASIAKHTPRPAAEVPAPPSPKAPRPKKRG